MLTLSSRVAGMNQPSTNTSIKDDKLEIEQSTQLDGKEQNCKMELNENGKTERIENGKAERNENGKMELNEKEWP
jgi:hypothetical protein